MSYARRRTVSMSHGRACRGSVGAKNLDMYRKMLHSPKLSAIAIIVAY